MSTPDLSQKAEAYKVRRPDKRYLTVLLHINALLEEGLLNALEPVSMPAMLTSTSCGPRCKVRGR